MSLGISPNLPQFMPVTFSQPPQVSAPKVDPTDAVERSQPRFLQTPGAAERPQSRPAPQRGSAESAQKAEDWTELLRMRLEANMAPRDEGFTPRLPMRSGSAAGAAYRAVAAAV